MNTITLGTAQDMRETIRRKSRLKGRQADAQALAQVEHLLRGRFKGELQRDELIEYLHVLNDAVGALVRAHLVALAKLMRLSMAEVYEVATFYHHFEVVDDEREIAATTIRVCDSLSCQLAGADHLCGALEQTLQNDTAKRVLRVPCVGRCEQAPVAVVGQEALPQASVAAVLAHLQTAKPTAAAQLPAAAHAFNPAASTLHMLSASRSASLGEAQVTGYATYCAAGGYALAQAVVRGERSGESLIAALEHSGLRGLGGAGFPAGRKWRIVQGQTAPRLMAVNIDEGEPGTFKDRTYLERDPHRFLEGVLIAAAVVGIAKVYIYLRDEYHQARHVLQQALDELCSKATFSLPELVLRRGAGAYICGEESAMIESIEGKRGEPRMRPPYIAQVGLFGRPTLEHNFETLYWVRDIVQRGADWFAGFGANGRKGLRSFSVSGRVKNPGVKLAPAGITLRELIDQYCGGMLEGHTLYAYLPGGASGGILPASLADVPLDFDTLQPHGCFIGSAAVIVLSQHDSARDAALNVMRFFEHESCGQCTPCRVGTAKAARLMQERVWDKVMLQDLSQVMADASICGLGQAAPNPIACVLKYFPHEVGA
jgi:formate dehydrogenase beta subunit